MFDANEVINGLYGFVYDENGKQMQETKAFEANVDYDKEEVLQAGKLYLLQQYFVRCRRRYLHICYDDCVKRASAS